MCYLGSDIGLIEGDKRDTRDEPNAPFLLAAPLAQEGQVGALSREQWSLFKNGRGAVRTGLTHSLPLGEQVLLRPAQGLRAYEVSSTTCRPSADLPQTTQHLTSTSCGCHSGC
jgi:hypothetical protein